MRLIRSRTLVFLLLAGILTGISIQTGHAQFVHAYIDPGHGGVDPDPFADPGYVTPIEGYFEKDVNLSVGLEVKEWFDDYPMFNVMYSRTEDVGVPRTTRAYEANGAGRVAHSLLWEFTSPADVHTCLIPPAKKIFNFPLDNILDLS